MNINGELKEEYEEKRQYLIQEIKKTKYSYLEITDKDRKANELP